MTYRADGRLRSFEKLLAMASQAGRVLRVIGHIGECFVTFARLFPVGRREFVARVAGLPVLRGVVRKLRVSRLRTGGNPSDAQDWQTRVLPPED